MTFVHQRRVLPWVLGGSALVLGAFAIATALALLSATRAEAEEPAATGSITIVENTVNYEAQDFEFVGCVGSACGPFTLDDDNDPPLVDTLTATDLAAGTYTITQLPIPNWSIKSLTCDTGETVDTANRRITISLTAGESTRCVFTNQTQLITILENTSPDGPQDFGFTGCQGAGCASFTLKDEPPFHDRSLHAAGLPPGTYTITQDGGAPLPLASIRCNTSENVNVGARRVTITLTANEHVDCTFTNQAPAITIVEDATPDDAHDFTFTGCQGAGCGSVSLDDDLDPALPYSVTANSLTAGTYTVTQTPDANWPLTSLTCTTSETVDLANRRVTITLGATEQTTCTFKNKSATITLVDDTTPDDSQDFTLHRCLGADCTTVTLDDDMDPTNPRSAMTAGLAPGTYTVTEDEQDDYELASIKCATGEAVEIDARRVSITLAVGEQQSCTFTNRRPPPPLTNVAEVAGGGQHTCARLVNDEARCWGQNGQGASEQVGHIGDGTDFNSMVPVPVSNPEATGPLTNVAQITAGGDHTCVRLDDGQARCWGTNRLGTLGDGTTTVRTRPVAVRNPAGTGTLTSVAQISASGYHSCALMSDHTARCWGENTHGELGDGTTTNRTLPVIVQNVEGTGPLSDIAQITAGFNHTCALLTDGQARCWGENAKGRLGDGTSVNRSRPVVVSNPEGTGPLTDVAQISAGGSWTCARMILHQATCWGDNTSGTLGDGTTTDRLLPVTVLRPDGAAPLTDVTQIEAGVGHTCALLVDGQVRCWGENDVGTLGDGTTTDRSIAVIVANPGGTGPLTDVAQIRPGLRDTCVTLANGQARCWGYNDSGRLGDGTGISRTRPATVIDPSAALVPLSDATAITARGAHSCALLTSSQARCWGTNSRGELGNPSVGTTSVAIDLLDEAGSAPLTGIASIDAGDYATCALMVDTTARCWGWNWYGNIGDGTTTDRTLPTPVQGPDAGGPLTGITQVSVGAVHACALLDDGHARCWGSNTNGELGDGTTTQRLLPVVVLNPEGTGPLADIVQIEAGERHTCALLSSGEARCWGYNDSGQLGDGTTDQRPLPVVVRDPGGTGPLTGITRLEANEGTCALLANGQALCWTPAPATDIAGLTMGSGHTCVRLTSGQVRCWGTNQVGELGDGTTRDSTVPVATGTTSGPLASITAISAGSDHTCTLDSDGQPLCWGLNNAGQLGEGTNAAFRTRAAPVLQYPES